jgi:ABC-type sugar transport system substrate-binding protein
LLNNKGNVAIMMGELSTQAAVLRTEGVEKVVAEHPDMKIVQKQTANWRRNEAIDLMNNWLLAGTKIVSGTVDTSLPIVPRISTATY